MRLILLLGLSCLILACGQKGPLYLPEADDAAAPAAGCVSCPPAAVNNDDTDSARKEKAATPDASPLPVTPQESTP